MVHLIVELSKYVMIIMFAVYTYQCFAVFRQTDPRRMQRMFRRQSRMLYGIHFTAFLVICLVTENANYLIFYMLQLALLIMIQVCYRVIYPKASRLLVNNMCMLLAVGFIILTRLDGEKAFRQFVIAAVSFAASLLIPYLIRRMGFFRRLTWVYAAVGAALLLAVCVLGPTSYGAKISLQIGPVAVQPSEFVKIIFVFFVAAMYYRSTDLKQVIITTAVAAVHVLILVASKDLGGALIFFVAYMAMVYVATKKVLYFVGGLAAGSVAAVAAYKLFSHVRARVVAWRTPLQVIDNEGYQICQSLFAIGTGGFFGMGLYQGMPDKIPKVEQDFIISAVAEEMGGLFAICVILVCVSCFLMFLNIAMQLKDGFYRLVALGLGTVYGIQVFLTLGGAVKFIPSTGVTLPLVSYGGSSMLSTLVIFAIIQGLYILREDEGAKDYGTDRKTKTEPQGGAQEIRIEDLNEE